MNFCNTGFVVMMNMINNYYLSIYSYSCNIVRYF